MVSNYSACLDSPKLYGYITSAGTSGETLSGSLVGSAELLNACDEITVTVHKEWIKDANGIQMEADHVFTFTTE